MSQTTEEKRAAKRRYYIANKAKICLQGKQRYVTNKAKIDQQHKQYYMAHKEEAAIRTRKYRRDNLAKLCRKNSQYVATHKAEIRRNQKQYQINRRIQVFDHYGHRCVCCGETTPAFLEIDHINGSGNKHRREVGCANMYVWLIKHNYPKGFQVLCSNCNKAKGVYGVCPHQLEAEDA